VSRPSVSVLLPLRDARDTLTECLDSLAAQSLADHEVVAVDDGSTDGSGDLLLERARADPRLRVLRRPARGIVAALNEALGAAAAPLVARMDADDVADPRRLLLQAARLREDSRTDVLGCRVELFGAHSEGLAPYVLWQNSLLTHEAMARDRLVESPLVHPSVMFRADALRALSGWREFPGPEDYDLWLRGFAAGWRFAKLEETLLRWRDRPRRLTRTDPRYAPACFQRVKLDALLAGPLAGGRDAVVWGAGRVGKGWARALRDAGRRVRAFVEVDPRKIGQAIGRAPVVAVAGAASFPGSLHLAAVGQKDARARIRAAAAALGLAEERDLIAVA
jgi:glycosyltransferase involved in cell wall biosynthesis